jgi:hypothetical protein
LSVRQKRLHVELARRDEIAAGFFIATHPVGMRSHGAGVSKSYATDTIGVVQSQTSGREATP